MATVAVKVVAFVLARCVKIAYHSVKVIVRIAENCEEPEEDSSQPAVSSIQHDIDAPSLSEDESELFSSPEESAAVDGLAPEIAGSGSTLPIFVRITENLNFVWGDVDDNAFTSLLDQVYNKIVHWRRNIFSLPTGRGRKMFVSELSRLMPTIQVLVWRELP